MPMLTAEDYFARREERIQHDKQTALDRLKENPAQPEILNTAAIEASEIYQKGALAQDRANLKRDLPNLSVNQWVCWIMLLPAGPTRSRDLTVSMSGYVLAVDMNRGHATVKIQCNPEGIDEYEYGKDVVVPMSAITQVMNPQPVVQGGPVFEEAKGPAFGKGKAGEFVKGGL